MSTKGLTHLIVNPPYDEPKHPCHYHRETQTFSLKRWPTVKNDILQPSPAGAGEGGEAG